jgi:carbonic anhydrase
MGHLTTLLKKIQFAVAAEKTITENRTSVNQEFVGKVTAINVRKTVQSIMEGSPILNEMIESGACGIVGGIHDISTGQVSFYDDTMMGFK